MSWVPTTEAEVAAGAPQPLRARRLGATGGVPITAGADLQALSDHSLNAKNYGQQPCRTETKADEFDAGTTNRRPSARTINASY